MYGLRQEILESTGSASHLANNLSIFFHETQKLIFASVIHKNEICVLSWNQNLISRDNLSINPDKSNTSFSVLQAKYCMPTCRTFPLLVVATSIGIKIYDVKTWKLLASREMTCVKKQMRSEQVYQFNKGITYTDNLIAVGSHLGELLVFECLNENTIIFKQSIQEHNYAISDMATYHFDKLTCSCDVLGDIVLWHKDFKTVQKKFSTGHEINCINILRKYIIIGTFTGQLLVYSCLNGQLMAEIHAHIRQINAIAVAPESDYMISVSDDTMIRLWKLYTHDNETFRIEWRQNEQRENMPLVGVQFVDGCGSGFVVTAYDHYKLFYYQIVKQ
ncbi:unnamed protein product [Thelazia callipaeda]|uniref:WD_REPEATS_REGION domain-containing protein n=1 Tax=Thelazia callipaeda TaxID=103827 RepID=A0A0N5CUQ1_THECL|nr:unnamed protein product [Thelazia callipaeda]